VDWSSTDNRRGKEAWRRFIEELAQSKCLLSRIDALAQALQNFDELITREGQKTFYCFSRFPDYDRRPFPDYEVRMAKILTRLFNRAPRIEPAAMDMARNSVRLWCSKLWSSRYTDKDAILPESVAAELLAAIEKHIAKAKSDPELTRRYRRGGSLCIEKRLSETAEDLITAYPKIRERRLKVRAPVAGAVPIRAWKPEFPGASEPRVWMQCDQILARGDRLLIPSHEHGVIVMNVKTMSVEKVMDFPLPGARHFIGGLTANDKDLMINLDNRLFVTPVSGDGKHWTEIDLPGVRKEDDLTWAVQGIGREFIVGSRPRDISPSVPPRMLAGRVRDGRLEWLVSSNRRPPVNPLDALPPPSSLCFAYRNPDGKTMLLLEREPWLSVTLAELETGLIDFKIPLQGHYRTRGEMPLYWNFADKQVKLLVAMDPARKEPRLLIGTGGSKKNGKWPHSPPIYKPGNPAFRGQCIAPIVYRGGLWLLKREPDIPGETEKHGPNDLRLVKLGLDGGKPVVVPLRYDVPAEIRKLGGEESSLERPIINILSLTATPTGLFFASSGYPNAYIGCTHCGGILSGGQRAPVLLYITWADIDAWLAKNAMGG